MIYRGIKRAKHGGYKTKLLQKETEARLEVNVDRLCPHFRLMFHNSISHTCFQHPPGIERGDGTV